ncbi:MAG: hypothetical protein HW391_437 [Chloroflexi bacterium]|nr:hypothetical protein [Chloroflexota bacterium]
MSVLARWAGVLAIAGGTILSVILIIVAFSPTSNVWYGLFLGVVLLGAAPPGLYWRTRPATGRTGLAAAWLSGLGALGTVAVAAYFIGTGELGPAQQNLPEGPATVVGMAASIAWLIGNLGFALALLRARALPPLGARLVLAGAFLAVAMTPFVGDDSPPALMHAATLVFGLVPVGWIVLGYSAWRQPRR